MMRISFTFLLLLFAGSLFAQEAVVIDKIVAIVGEEIILKSDIENELLRQRSEGQIAISGSKDDRINTLEELLIHNLLLAQAKVDSVFVTDEDVERQLNDQINQYVRHFGSEERVETIFGKPLEEIRVEFRQGVKNQLITRQMQSNIIQNVRVTPAEVRNSYRKIDKDILPEEPAKYEIQQIVVKPRITARERERVRTQLRGYRDKVMEGEASFSQLAMLYSEDEESSIRGGDLGYRSKNDFQPEFSDAAFALKPGRLSRIVETDDGFHLINYIDRQGERIRVAHILLRPRIEEESRDEALSYLDTIADIINKDKIPFETVASEASQDKNTRYNGGLIINDQAESKLRRDELHPDVYRQILTMSPGDISAPFIDRFEDKDEYKIIRYKAYHPPHVPNLEEDWMLFENELLMRKREEVFMKWIRQRQESTYIHIDEEYRGSALVENGWIK